MNKKTVCLNMIVKNESGVIKRCLASVKSLIDYWVIVDTGSEDGTQDVITDYLKDIPGQLFERPWVNFAHNRNEALFYAKNKGDYLLFIDADDWLEISDEFVLPDLYKDCYAVEFFHGYCRSAQVLFANNRIDWKWEGVVHEAIDYSECSGEILRKIVKRASFDGNRSIDIRKKNLRDAAILERALQDDPDNSRNVFNFAGCLEAAEEYEKALPNFEKRAQMKGDPLEIYFSLYRIGALQEKLQFESNVFINSYLKAFHYRSHRLEPLYCLSDYFIRSRCFFMGYLIARYALSIPFMDDYFFTQYPIYDYGLKNQMTECSLSLYKFFDERERSSHEMV